MRDRLVPGAVVVTLAVLVGLFFLVRGDADEALAPPQAPTTAAGAAPEAPPDAGPVDRAGPRPEDAPPTDDGTPRDAEVAIAALGGASPLTDEELAALEEELQNSPQTHVICDVAVPVRHREGYLAIGGHSGFNGRRVQVVNGRAYLPLVYDLGELGDAVFDERSGVFSLEGYGPQALEWSDPGEDGRGACRAPIAPEPARASLVGTLTLRTSGRPAAGAWVEGCGNMAFADEQGVVYMDIVTEPCTLLAMRQDGMLRTVSEPVPITPVPGEDVVVDIQIPDAPRGGLGVQIGQDDDGRIVIDGVLETGPAESAGLREGDVVTGVDGQPTAGMPLGEFVEAVGGEAGTPVEIEIDRAGERLTFDITRETLTDG